MPIVLAVTIALTAGCGGDDGGIVGLDPAVFELALVSGGAQTGLAGTVLDELLVARVSSIEGGDPTPGVAVNWRVVQGDAEATRTRSGTGANGEAATLVVLGSTAGVVTVEASVAGLEPVTFEPHTVLPAPTIASVSPNDPDPGDEIKVRVNDLPAAFIAQVLFDGVAGEVTSRVNGSPTVLNTIVPAPVGVCSATTEAVDVRVRVGSITTDSRTVNVTVPANPFQVGQVLVIEGTLDVQCALLPSSGGTAQYLLVALSAAFEIDGLFQVTLGAGNVVVAAADGAAASVRPGFRNRLRAIEQRLAAQGLSPARPSGGAKLFAAPSLGEQRDFWVLNNVEAADDGLTQSDFDRVAATLKFIGANTLIYLDNLAPGQGLTDADLQALGDVYDRMLYFADVDFFGQPSDVDDDDRVTVLLSPTVNRLTEPGSKGVVVGFFFGLDLFDPFSCGECRFSNGGEILYGLVPDPDGAHGDPRTRERVLDLMPSVMVHETQHMISFNYKIFINGGLSLETLWLSEALSHSAEEKGADEAFDAGETELANDLYASNFGRAAFYLEDPSDSPLTVVAGSGTLGERGASWLFMRWMADQYGDFILRRLTQSPRNGVNNVEQETGEPFFRLFADWAVANWADEQDIAGLSERYQVPKWDLRGILQTGDPPAYALQPLQQTFAQFRSSSVVEFLESSSPFYVELDAAGDNSDLQLQLSATTDAGLAILRIQ